MEFDIVTSAPTPIYRQIVDQVRRMVASGQLRAGDDLPSIRTVALKHTVNPMTVSKAYGLLEAQGLVERRRGVGMVVASANTPSSTKDKLALLRPALLHAAQVAKQLGIEDAHILAAFEDCLKEWKSNDPSDT